MEDHHAHTSAPADERGGRPDAHQPYRPVDESGAGEKGEDERRNAAAHQNRPSERNIVINRSWDECGADCDPRRDRECRQAGGDYAKEEGR